MIGGSDDRRVWETGPQWAESQLTAASGDRQLGRTLPGCEESVTKEGP